MAKGKLIKKIKEICCTIKYYPYRDEKSYYMFHNSSDDILRFSIIILVILIDIHIISFLLGGF